MLACASGRKTSRSWSRVALATLCKRSLRWTSETWCDAVLNRIFSLSPSLICCDCFLHHSPQARGSSARLRSFFLDYCVGSFLLSVSIWLPQFVVRSMFPACLACPLESVSRGPASLHSLVTLNLMCACVRASSACTSRAQTVPTHSVTMLDAHNAVITAPRIHYLSREGGGGHVPA